MTDMFSFLCRRCRCRRSKVSGGETGGDEEPRSAGSQEGKANGGTPGRHVSILQPS